MLLNTFSHIPSIGPKAEENLWSSGIRDWDAFTEPFNLKLSHKKIELIKRYIEESRVYLDKNSPDYFESLLQSNLHWRFFPEFRGSSVYLDIETDGEEVNYGTITTIALYDGKDVFHYINGENLNDFMDDIQKYDVIITYNGKCFDVPFIENFFGVKLNRAHIDLRYILASLGYRGGLKKCELAMGIDRGDLTGVDGFFAVLLWRDYMANGNSKALETLLAYNIEDVVNLETLMVKAYNQKLQTTPFHTTHQLSESEVSPEIPFKPDFETIEKLKMFAYY